ncbi:hypothetical protein BCF55_0672 [Hydrogenivirga caldilitoris]|uniref:Uncharacterized protein n=1 Tax=Hydrogenivirga caldilitoris TaxID=246264 RepID=A0A497XQG9_9AQUI|nr:hypothetical protein [Hydrogenivirga caldilitoris]RLJ70400.1 hypothetical protein BCF55_0672 [Hydrogenivirga caldilitoris]
MIEVTEKTTFVKLTPLYIILGLLFLLLSLTQRGIGWGDYTATVLYFSVPSVVVGVLFQLYPVLQGIPSKLQALTYLHLLLFLSSFCLYILELSFGVPYFLSSLIYMVYILFNTRRYSGQVQLFFLVGSVFYLLASYFILVGETNQFLVKHTLAVGFLLTVSFGGIYLLLPMLQLERLYFSNNIWLHLSFHTFFTIDFLISWKRFSFQHIYISGLLILATLLFHLFILYKTLSRRESPLKGLDPSIRAFLLSLIMLTTALVVGVLSAGSQDFSILKLHSDVLLYGFFPILTLGASYHIIPFMLWWKGFAPKLGKEKVPTLKELFPEKFLEISLLLISFSLFGMVGSLFLKGIVQIFFSITYALGIMLFLLPSLRLSYKFLKA